MALVALATLLVVSVTWRALSGDAEAGAQPAPPAAGVTSTPSPAPTSTADVVAEVGDIKDGGSDVTVVQRGTGVLDVVPGAVPAPGRGPVMTVRVEVEHGSGVAAQGFADAVMTTLNDDRSWGHGGTRTFARTAGPADIVVVLASPDTSSKLCRPLVTKGRLSCSIGDRAIVTTYRWLNGTEEFADLGIYRQYVVNHEVGHVLGHGHRTCSGAGRPAPVMQQQTIRVAPCTPNAWPFA